MITDAIVQALLGALTALVSLLPNMGPITLGADTSTAVMGWTGAANTFFPVTAVVLVLGALLALQLALMLWDLAVWIYHQVWGSD